MPTRILIGAAVFLVLLFGGYLIGSTDAARSTMPTYITDPSGSNGVTVNRHGHMSVHIADANMPVISGPADPTRLQFPEVAALTSGQCYEAFVRGEGSVLTASFTNRPGTGGGRPDVLVRIDRDVVWLEDGTSTSTPVSTTSGVTRSGSSYVFGFSYMLQFKLFAGVDVCWHGSGTSDAFSVQLTASSLHTKELHPETVTFGSQASPAGRVFRWSHRWVHTPGGAIVGFAVAGTDSTEVAYYHRLHPVISYDAAQHDYSTVVTKPSSYLRYFLIENQLASDPTRAGPFGNWKGL